ncbi:Uncharacterized protein Rs2_35552 [Raphanus sativus]|nr:Uncharacterized protein Rs2_35552 [Raphanus sativus]
MIHPLFLPQILMHVRQRKSTIMQATIAAASPDLSLHQSHASSLRLRTIPLNYDESPRRHEQLTEGVNLKTVSFMAQFHSSRPDCNLYASWVSVNDEVLCTA